jgi:cytochrome c
MRFAALQGVVLVVTTLSANEALAAGNVVNGKAIFQRTCQNCHSTQIGVNKIGPSLWSVVGRRSASVPDFNYSDSLKALNKSWDDRELDSYLSNPRGTVHGVRMFFKGLPSAQARADVIAYLATLK